MKWEESGRSDTFFQRDDLTEVGDNEIEQAEDEEFATGDEAEVTRDDEGVDETEEVAVDEDSNEEEDAEAEENEEEKSRRESRGSECSDYEQWVENNLLIPSSDEEPLDYNPGENSTALRIIDPLPRDSSGRVIRDPAQEGR